MISSQSRLVAGLALSCALALNGCVGALEDEEGVHNSRVTLRPSPRGPNNPPGNGLLRGDASVDGNLDNGRRSDNLGSSDNPPSNAADDDGPVVGLPAECGNVPRDIFGSTSKCGTALCHGSPGQPITGELGVISDLGHSTNNVFERLKDVEVTQGQCAGRKVIDTKNPNESLLISKLENPAPCGNTMPFPLPGFQLSRQDKNCIIQWTRLQIENR